MAVKIQPAFSYGDGRQVCNPGQIGSVGLNPLLQDIRRYRQGMV